AIRPRVGRGGEGRRGATPTRRPEPKGFRSLVSSGAHAANASMTRGKGSDGADRLAAARPQSATGGNPMLARSHQNLIALLALALALTGCYAEPSHAELDSELGEQLADLAGEPFEGPTASASCWSPPGPIDPSMCAGQEELSRPPDPWGFCEIEIRLKESSFVTGQGVSEGRGEISFVATATSGSGVVSASSSETKYSV